MRRRDFAAMLGLSLASRVRAQVPQAIPRIGFLHPASAEGSAVYPLLVSGLGKLGYVDGKTIRLETRSGKGVAESLPKLIAELLALNPDALVVVGPASVRAAASATQTVPIIAVDLESDPVQAGWMKSLSRPGGNVTGFFLDLTGMSAKWLQLMREAMPNLRTAGLVWDTTTGDTQLAATRAAAAQFGVRVHTVPIDNWKQFEGKLAAALHERPQAFIVLSSPIAFQYSEQFAAFTLRNRVPAISPFRPFAVAGGLMSYGPDLDLFFQRTAATVDRILRGARPSELAVEQPDKYELVINQKTGQALGMTLPKPLLLRADEVIR